VKHSVPAYVYLELINQLHEAESFLWC